MLVPFSGAAHDWAAIELAAWIARARELPLRLAGSSGGGDGRDSSRLLASASLAIQRVLGVAAEPLLVEPGADQLVRAAEDAGLVVLGLSERWQQRGSERCVARSSRARSPRAPRTPRPSPRGACAAREHDALHLDARARCLRRLPRPARRRPLHAGGSRLARRWVRRLEVAAEARVDPRDRPDHASRGERHSSPTLPARSRAGPVEGRVAVRRVEVTSERGHESPLAAGQVAVHARRAPAASPPSRRSTRSRRRPRGSPARSPGMPSGGRPGTPGRRWATRRRRSLASAAELGRGNDRRPDDDLPAEVAPKPWIVPCQRQQRARPLRLDEDAVDPGARNLGDQAREVGALPGAARSVSRSSRRASRTLRRSLRPEPSRTSPLHRP